MRPLARFIMRGYSPATMVATVAGLLSLLIPLVGVLGSAAVGLVTLRQGGRPGAWVMLGSTLACALIAWLALGNPWLAIGVLVLLWAPIWVLAMLLRLSRSLALTLQFAALGGMTVVLGLFWTMGDPVAYWRELLDPLGQVLVSDGLLDGNLSQVLLERLARWMAVGFVAAMLFQSLIGLMVARAWQSQLYYPGGFTAEFHALRLHPVAGGLFLLLLGWGLVTQGLALALAAVLAVVLVFQGLAVIHGLLALRGIQHGWLGALYALWLLFLPQMTVLLVSLGLIDLWLDLRGRFARYRSKRA